MQTVPQEADLHKILDLTLLSGSVLKKVLKKGAILIECSVIERPLTPTISCLNQTVCTMRALSSNFSIDSPLKNISGWWVKNVQR